MENKLYNRKVDYEVAILKDKGDGKSSVSISDCSILTADFQKLQNKNIEKIKNLKCKLMKYESKKQFFAFNVYKNVVR